MKRKKNQTIRNQSQFTVPCTRRIQKTIRAMTNPEKSNSKPSFGYSTKTRHLRPRNAGETSDIRIDKKDSSIWW